MKWSFPDRSMGENFKTLSLFSPLVELPMEMSTGDSANFVTLSTR
jgi:hypothetical protein